MRKLRRFILVNVILITLINVVISLIGRLTSIEFTYEYSSISLSLISVVIPTYLIVIKNVLISDANNEFFSYDSICLFVIVSSSNLLMYIIDSKIFDKIFEVPADLDNFIIFFIFTISQFLVLTILFLLNLLFKKLRKAIT